MGKERRRRTGLGRKGRDRCQGTQGVTLLPVFPIPTRDSPILPVNSGLNRTSSLTSSHAHLHPTSQQMVLVLFLKYTHNSFIVTTSIAVAWVPGTLRGSRDLPLTSLNPHVCPSGHAASLVVPPTASLCSSLWTFAVAYVFV